MTDFITAHQISGTLGLIDLVVVGLAIILLFVISYIFGREEKDTKDFFVGGRKSLQLWPAFLLSLLKSAP